MSQRKISPTELAETCKSFAGVAADRQNVQRAVDLLGGLALWWLKPEVLDFASENGIALPQGSTEFSTEPGNCWMVCELKGESEMLRNAVFVPLIWEKEQAYCKNLPVELRDLSQKVVAELTRSMKGYSGLSRYWLNPHPRSGIGRHRSLEDGIFSSVDSAWASLTTSLVSATLKQHVVQGVLASASWNENGIAKVGGIAQKVELVSSWPGVSTFCVPQTQKEEAQEELQGRQGSIEIVGLHTQFCERKTRTPDLSSSLRELQVALFQQPKIPTGFRGKKIRYESAEFQRCKYYFEKVVQPYSPMSRHFYTTRLLPAITANCKEKAAYKISKATHYVSIVSKSPELAVLGARIVNAEKCLLLYTEETSPYLAYCRDQLHDLAIYSKPISKDRIVEDVKTEIDAFLTGLDDDQHKNVVLDIKAGSSEMTYAIVKAARDEHKILCIDHKWTDGRRISPGTESPQFF